MNKYLRIFKVLIETGTYDSGNTFVKQNEKELSELKISFNFRNTLLGDPSLGHMQFYNLKGATKDLFNAEACRITVTTGYNDSTGTLFFGDVTNSYEIREGTETIHNVWIRDSWKVLEQYVDLQSIVESTPRKSVLNKLVSSLPQINSVVFTGDSENIIQSSSEITSHTFGDSVKDELTDILDPAHLGWQVKFGSLYIVNKEEKPSEVGSETIYDINRRTGLLSRPEVSYTGIKFEHLLDFRLQPPYKINVTPNTVTYNLGNEYYVPQDQEKWKASGIFRIMEVTHRGDTRGNLWRSDVRAFYKN